MTMDVNRMPTIAPILSEQAPTFSSNKNNDAKIIEKSIQGRPEIENQAHGFSTEKTHHPSEELNRYLENHLTRMGFFMYDKLDNQVVMEIKSRKTGELLKQVPSEEILKIREKMVASAGLILDIVG